MSSERIVVSSGTYGCNGRPLAGETWKEGGRCQHDSFADERCGDCWQRRKDPKYVPEDGTGGLEKGR